MTIKAGIIGVSGYGGGELARLLSQHPEVDLTYVSSESSAAKCLAEVLPGFMGRSKLICEPFSMSEALSRCDVVFAAQEGGWAANNAPMILSAGKKLIDLSADFRLRDPAVYEIWYKNPAPDKTLQNQAVYGLPELFREQIKGASLVANPGCFPTAAVLGLAPAIREGLIDESLIAINGLSGVSGAGRSKQTLQYHFPELNENASAYAIAGAHRHTPEIEQALSDVVGQTIVVSFTPHLIPITRGILTTIVAPVLGGATEDEIFSAYHSAYESEPFVHVLPPGNLPTTKQTYGSNNVLIGLAVDKRLDRLTVVAVGDNLVKGMAGQAIQNMNIICGLDETTGLDMPGMWP